MKKRSKLLRKVLCMMLSASLLLSCAPVYAADEYTQEVKAEQSAEEEKEQPTEAEGLLSDQEGEDAWSEYLESLDKAGKAAIRIRLDDAALSGCKLYYEGSGSLYHKPIAELVESGTLISVTPSSTYGGVWEVDKNFADVDTNYWTKGNFYLYKNEAVMFQDYYAFIWHDEVFFKERKLADIDLYTMSFEAGEHEVLALPESLVTVKGRSVSSYTLKPAFRSAVYLYGDVVESPGYLLAYWADQEGKDTRGDYRITKPITLHPVFVNEQEAKYHHSDYSSYANENYYWDWCYDEDTEDHNAVPAVVTTAAELIEALKDTKYTFVIVSGEITLKANEVKQILDEKGIGYSWYDEEGPLRFSAYKGGTSSGDFLIIPKGAKLTLDQVELTCAVNWESAGLYITVQDGGVFSLINRGALEYGEVAVQEGGLIDVDNASCLDCDYLYNHGTIRFAEKPDYDSSKDNRYLQRLLIHNTFINFKTGVLEAEYGNYEFKLEYCSWLYGDEVNELGDLRIVRMRNEGSMSFTKNCRVEIAGSSSQYQHDRCAQMPFVNNGSFTLQGVSSKNTLYNNRSVLRVEYGSFANNGKLSIHNANGTFETSGSSLYMSGGGVEVYEGELINNGTIDLENTSGNGIRFEGLFYDPEKSGGLSRTSVDTPQRGRLNNNETGTITVKCGKGAIGLAYGTQTELNNKGIITLEYANAAEMEGAMALVVLQGSYADEDASAIVNNNGSIVNNAYIAYARKEDYHWNGDKWSGSGKEGKLLSGSEPGPGPDPKPVDPPVPVPGSGEATDPQPEITSDASQDIILVEGQKFSVGKGWTTKDTKYLSVNKKTGAVKAKKAGTAVMSYEDGVYTINVTIVKPALKKNTKLEAGVSEVLTVSGAEGLKVLWESSAPDVAAVDKEGRVTAVSKGSAKITAWINGSAYKCTVKVTETAAAAERTMHLNVNGSKTPSIKGLSKPEWVLAEDSEEGIVQVISGKKIKGIKAGEVTLVSGNGKYRILVRVENPAIEGTDPKKPYKKTEELNMGATTAFKLTSVTQEVVFKSSKNSVAFVSPLPDEDGNYTITARGKGTASLTAVVNSRTITISVKVK